MRTKQRFNFAAPSCLALLALLAPLALVTAPAPAAGQVPTIELPSDAGAVVVEYTLVHHMLEESDPEPLLRIHADGRVRVHYPVYMAKAGDYETRLSESELRGLLLSLAAIGILDFDGSAVQAERGQAEAADRADGRLVHISDVTDTVIDVKLASYLAPGTLVPTDDFEKSIRWPNVYTDAQRFAGVTGIQSLARAEEQLRSIMNRPDLVKIR